MRIEGAEPVMLSNGNPGASGASFAEWHDPGPNPPISSPGRGRPGEPPRQLHHRQRSHRQAQHLVPPGDEDKCAFGMEALKKSMKWDEDTYGREYDLDLFNIVAVDDFNMGAMENKG
ncbi:MAG: M1 family aminopeptidase [Paracoccaceae bacterium]